MREQTKEKYRVVATKFIGNNTYEITFNKSLEHTGRYTGIENGLNEYVEKEKVKDVKESFLRLMNAIKRIF